MADLRDAGTRPVVSAEAAKYARLSGVLAVVFAVLMSLALILVNRSPGFAASDQSYDAFYAPGGKTVLITVGLYLIPFAGIAFLWHMITVRLLVRELAPDVPKMPMSLQVLAGGLFVALLWVGTAAAGAVALVVDIGTGPVPGPDVGRALSGIGYAVVFVYAVRAAGMYVMTTTTLLMKAALLPRWLGLLSYVLALAMLIATTFNPAVLLVLPGWAVLVGVIVLVRAGRPGARAIPEAAS
ncbi:MAG: hypothetical protein J0I34_30220 [Pseudonocardia sp.]|uniref:hypothetical protein n=1 Tax=unclassified Pseudonocardia TaxID=2619320 RepID=UPI00086B399C|nr:MULTISPECIES: hypothetical protein [unclassified Pseudonocardia]MBN9113049.1 hypothetical protein [Pseudonocardia sp.]ODU24788.1 MAG: hypothetical protein ABS80_11495 [Pseudonocardia sp. SCN 72-51]ODV05523.1 MAG: hypothetical protein ABT15_16785 [Pseudonocardia sp. SCN 73-27]